MEKIWSVISSRIDGFFFDRKMRQYTLSAFKIKERVDAYLDAKGIRHVSGVFPADEPDWPKVRVEVLLDIDDYKELFKVWEELCAIGYKGMSSEEIMGVFIGCESRIP